MNVPFSDLIVVVPGLKTSFKIVPERPCRGCLLWISFTVLKYCNRLFERGGGQVCGRAPGAATFKASELCSAVRRASRE